MNKIGIAIIGLGFASVLFVPYASAEMGADSSKATKDMGSEKSKATTKPGETDITNTKGQGVGDVPTKYTVMPVARGQKIDVDHEMIGDTVTNPKGEELGKLERLIMDSKTQKIEYAMISIGDTGQYKAFPWSNFKVDREKGNVVLNMTKEQLQPGLATTDLSPDVNDVVERELSTLRRTEPQKSGTREGLGITQQPAAAGSMGEEKVGGGGPAGPRGLPPGQAPSFEGGK